MKRRTTALVAGPLLAVAALVVAVLVVGGGEAEPPATVLAVGSETVTLEAAASGSAPVTAPAAPSTTTARTQSIRPQISLGDSGEDVALLQERLHGAGYDPGPVDGTFRMPLFHAVQAFQKVHGREPTGVVGLDTWRDLASPKSPAVLVPDGEPTRVEVDLARQLLYLYEDGDLTLVTHVSTGSGERFCTDRGGCRYADTPAGDYEFTWRVDGWRESDLGLLYNPVYFHGGIAIHGSYHIPTTPSSYGCVRIPMHIAEYFPSRVSRGDPVYVRG